MSEKNRESWEGFLPKNSWMMTRASAPADHPAVEWSGDLTSKILVLIPSLSQDAEDLFTRMLGSIGLDLNRVCLGRVNGLMTNQDIEPQMQIPRVVILSFGESLAHNLLNQSESLEALRNVHHEFMSALLIPTYSPNDVILRPDLKKSVWQDLKKVSVVLNGNRS